MSILLLRTHVIAQSHQLNHCFGSHNPPPNCHKTHQLSRMFVRVMMTRYYLRPVGRPAGEHARSRGHQRPLMKSITSPPSTPPSQNRRHISSRVPVVRPVKPTSSSVRLVTHRPIDSYCPVLYARCWCIMLRYYCVVFEARKTCACVSKTGNLWNGSHSFCATGRRVRTARASSW